MHDVNTPPPSDQHVDPSLNSQISTPLVPFLHDVCHLVHAFYSTNTYLACSDIYDLLKMLIGLSDLVNVALSLELKLICNSPMHGSINGQPPVSYNIDFVFFPPIILIYL